MRVHTGVLLAILALGCDMPPSRSAADTNASGGTRSPKDLTIPLRRALQTGDAFWVFEGSQLENGVVAGRQFGRDMKFTLCGLSNDEYAITMRDYGGWVAVGTRNGSWGRYMESTSKGAFQPFPENTYSYYHGTNREQVSYFWVGSGEDNLGRSDTFLTLSGGGDTIKVGLSDLHLQRVRDMVARSKVEQWVSGTTAKGYRCLEDGEGYLYVVNLRWGADMVVELWDPFVFEPAFLGKIERREVNPLSLKPLAAFEMEWRKAGSISTPVDLSALRRRVYGVDGERDVVHFASRESEKWFLEGGLETAYRKAQNHVKKGHELHNAGKKNEAAIEYTKAVELDGRSADAFYWRAMSSVDSFYNYALENIPTKTLRRIIQDLSRAMELAPGRYKTADTLSKRALCLAVSKDAAAAEADYTEVLRLQPSNLSAYRERRAMRSRLGNSDGVAADDVEIARLEEEEKRKSEENRLASLRKAEEDRRDAPDRILVDAGVAKWSYDTSTYGTFVPPHLQKVELFKRRLKDVNEKPIVVQLAGTTAENGGYKFEQMGFKLLKGKKVDSEEKIHLIIQADSDSSGDVKNGQGRVLESLSYGKSVMDRAYNTVLVLFLKNKLDWSSEKYAEIAAYWDKAEQKARENDPGAAVEALDEIIRLDGEDKAAPTRKMQILEEGKNWAGVAAECTRLLQIKADDHEVRRRRLKASEELKDSKGVIEDLGWLADNSKEDYYRKDFLSRKAAALAKAGRWKEGADALAALIEKSPRDASLYDRRAECFASSGEPDRADQMRAKALEIRRSDSAEAVSVQEGIATWAEHSTTIVLRPEFRARHALVSMRLRDASRVVAYFVGSGDLGGALEKAGLQVESERPARYDVGLEVSTQGECRVTLPGGQVLGSIRVSGYYAKDAILAAVRAFATRGRLPLLSAAYESLLPVYEDLVAAAEAGDEAKELALRQRIADAMPSHYEFQMEYLRALERAEEWAKVVDLGIRIAGLDRSLVENYRKLAQVNYSIPIDPVEGGLKAAIAARLKLGQGKEALAEAEAWMAHGSDKRSALRQKVELLKALGEYRAAAESIGALAAMQLKEATYDYQRSYAINDYFVQGDLFKLAGDEPGARDAYRKAVMVTLKEYGYLASRALERARRGDFPGAMADVNDALEKQGDKVQASTYVTRAQIRVMRGDSDGALLDYASALRISKEIDVYRARAALLRKQGRAAEADAVMKEAWSQPLTSAYSAFLRAKERLAAGDSAGALEDHARALELADQPNERAMRLSERATTRAALKDTEGALEDLAKAAETTRDRGESARFGAMRAETRLAAGDVAGALQEYGKAIDVSPIARQRADLLEKRATLKLASGDVKGTIEDLSHAISSEETWARVLRRAAVHRRFGERSRAADDVKFALTLPFKPTECASFATALNEAGAPTAGLEIYEKSLPMLARTRRALYLMYRAGFRMSLQDAAGAEKDYDAAVAEAPRFDVLISRAQFRKDRGNEQGARADLAAACLMPVDTTSYYGLTSRAATRFGLGDKEGAWKDSDEALRRFPREAPAHAARADLLARAGRFDEALAAAEKAQELNRTDYSTCRILGLLLGARGRKEDGAQAVDAYPYKDSEYFWEMKAMVEAAAGDLEGAIKICQAGAAKFPAGSALRNRIADLRLEQGNLDEALKLAEKSLSLNVQDAFALRIRGIVQARQGHPDAAKTLAMVTERGGDAARVEILVAGKKLDEAFQAAGEYAARYPRYPTSKLLLAMIHAAKGDRKAAGDLIKAGLELTGWDDVWTRAKFARLRE